MLNESEHIVSEDVKYDINETDNSCLQTSSDVRWMDYLYCLVLKLLCVYLLLCLIINAFMV